MLVDIAAEGYVRGVQAGYYKILDDHRAGHLNVSNSPRSVIDAAITKALKGELKPSEFFGDKS